MSTRTSAGSVIAITASAPTTFDATGFGALTPTEIGEVTNIGDFGRVYNKVAYNPLKTRATQKRKGSYDPGALNLQLAIDDAGDAGQTLLRTALLSDNDYYFCITTQSGAKVFFKGQVFSFKENVGGVDDMYNATCTIEINAHTTGVDFVRVAAP